MHVKVKISEEVDGTLMSGTEEDYRVLGMYTKTYNKWFVSKETKVAWTVGMAKEKVRVYMQMIEFDHSVEKFKDVKPGKNIFVLGDAVDIVDVVQKISPT